MAEAAFKKGALAVLLLVYCLDVRVEQYIDEFRQGLVRILPEQEMVMVWHQAISDDSYVVFLMISLDEPQQVFVISRIEKQYILARAPVKDMVEVIFREDIAAIRHVRHYNPRITLPQVLKPAGGLGGWREGALDKARNPCTIYTIIQ